MVYSRWITTPFGNLIGLFKTVKHGNPELSSIQLFKLRVNIFPSAADSCH
jgi:hypothetical protein